MRYYEIAADDCHFADRWFLAEPVAADGAAIDAREFRYGRQYHGQLPKQIPIQQSGKRVNFVLAAFDMPVVAKEIAHQIDVIAPGAVECFPVTIEADNNGFVIMNVIRRIACVDEDRSIVTRWTANDYRTDRIGQYRMISNLKVDPDRADGQHIFRIKDFEITLIVSETLKQAIESFPELGIVFKPVT